MKEQTFLTTKDFALKSIIEQISGDENLVHYKNYCQKRLDGLRKEAFAELNVFLKVFSSAPFEARRLFVDILLSNADSAGKYLTPDTMPHPLNEQVIKPTLDEWAKKERENYLPLYWSAKYFYDYDALERALLLNPSEQKPLLLFIERNLSALFYSTHHLPDYYCGNIKEDMLLLSKLDEKIRLVEDDEVKKTITDDFCFLRALVWNYFEFRQSGEKDFAVWGAKNGKQVSSNVSSYYYTK